MAHCTGAYAQYISLASCLGTCAAFPPGTAGDTSGNSLACRAHYAGAPAQADPVGQCAAAGPSGGDQVVSDAIPGTCGEGCDSFCTIDLSVCNGTDSQYADKAICVYACPTMAALAGPYSTADSARNDWGCRLDWATRAAESSAAGSADCKLTVPGSTVCTQ